MTRSRISLDSKLLPLIAVLTFMVLAAWLAFTHDQYRSVGKLLADQHGASVEASYRASSRMYQLSAGIMFRELSRHPAVIDWLETANGGDEHERARIRDWFSKLLRSDYLRLRDEGFVQFQIHLADGSVVHRLHRPEAFGDALTGVRPSVRLAHAQRRTIVGFEAGRGYPVLRHVFPVEYERQLLGSIELSVPFTRLQQRFEELLPGNTFLIQEHQRHPRP